MRFSPYHSDPARHGIRNVRPRPYYTWAYPVPGIDLDKLAYRFDYDHDMFADGELIEARRSFVKRALAWHRGWRPDMLYHVDGAGPAGALAIVDQRGTFPRRYTLTGVAAAIFRHLDRVRTWDQLRSRFAAVAPELLAALLDVWQRRRWLCRDGDHYLAVVPQNARQAARRPHLEPQATPAEPSQLRGA
jgi:hypothetical protein